MVRVSKRAEAFPEPALAASCDVVVLEHGNSTRRAATLATQGRDSVPDALCHHCPLSNALCGQPTCSVITGLVQRSRPVLGDFIVVNVRSDLAAHDINGSMFALAKSPRLADMLEGNNTDDLGVTVGDGRTI